MVSQALPGNQRAFSPGARRGALPGRAGGALALAALLFFQVFLISLQVKAVYATGLGAWSLAHHGPVARNLNGIAWHLFDLPFKLARPFALWAGFYLHRMAGEGDQDAT